MKKAINSRNIDKDAVDRLYEEMERKPWLYSNIEVKEV